MQNNLNIFSLNCDNHQHTTATPSFLNSVI